MYKHLPQELKDYLYFCGWKYELVKGTDINNHTYSDVTLYIDPFYKGYNANVDRLVGFHYFYCRHYHCVSALKTRSHIL